jgi:hypothetical protein
MPRPVDSDGPPPPFHIGGFVLPSCLFKHSASATIRFRSCTSTSGSATSPTAYRILCLRLAHLVRNLMAAPPWTQARYGWVANPYKDALLHLLPTGTFTLQDTPSLSRRDMDTNGIIHSPNPSFGRNNLLCVIYRGSSCKTPRQFFVSFTCISRHSNI